MASQRASRHQAELAMLTKNPPPGIEIRIEDDKSDVIFADISGPPGSPFENGVFTVEVSLSERYPFTPPNARFLTPIYHPNVDTDGRICLSGLKPKPAGTWNCSLNIAVILSAIRLLLDEPNLSDPLMADIAAEYQKNISTFRAKAKAHTRKFAMKKSVEEFDLLDEDTQAIAPSTDAPTRSPSDVSVNSKASGQLAKSPSPLEEISVKKTTTQDLPKESSTNDDKPPSVLKVATAGQLGRPRSGPKERSAQRVKPPGQLTKETAQRVNPPGRPMEETAKQVKSPFKEVSSIQKRSKSPGPLEGITEDNFVDLVSDSDSDFEEIPVSKQPFKKARLSD